MLKCFREWRVLSIVFVVFSCKLAIEIARWFMGLDAPNNAQGAFASAVVLSLVGIGKYWMETKAVKHGED